MKIIGIGGEPGCGKTTLMKSIIDTYSFQKRYKDFKLVPYLQINNNYILGIYENDGYAQGTDKMSMSVQPQAIKFIESLPTQSTILFEGDRLFNSSFLSHCCKYDLKVIYLSTKKEIREERCNSRNSNQNETWLKGRETKISNILSNLELFDKIEKFDNNNLEDQKKVIDFIQKEIYHA